ncbi:translation initiation factor IF-2-like [Vanessa cardui]|uniref:translation initiation factor IF-2-like n=1 Tax=Vanessa cardui TaxID=171605 RepID=UPI001F12D481|nr:translation initiation factor IF-2-like [Vanessa cardui]
MDVDTELSSDALVGRKRPYGGLAIFNSDSDTETEMRLAAKSKPAIRGKTAKGRGSGLARAKAELKAKASEAREEAFERSLRSRAFRKDAPQVVVDSEESSSSDVHTEDPTKMGAEELRAQAGRSAALILEVAQKSTNLKGGFAKRLKESAAALQGIVDALAARTEAEETRKLRADNGRLRKEVDSLKAEVKAHRREFAEMRTKVAGASDASGSAQDAQMERFKASIISSVGDMINARFAVLEERLPPAKIHRPPLAADKRREVAQQIATPYTQAVQPAPPPKAAPASKRAPPAVPTASIAGPSGVQPTSVIIPPQMVQEVSWSTVVKKGKKGKQASLPTVATTTVAPTVPKAGQASKPKLSAPRTAAVVLERAEQSVKLQDLGINGGLKVRRSATGARVLELPKAQMEQAEKLADKLRKVLDGVANVARPIRKVDIKVTGLDDSVTKDKIIAAVVREGSCPAETVSWVELGQSVCA